MHSKLYTMIIASFYTAVEGNFINEKCYNVLHIKAIIFVEYSLNSLELLIQIECYLYCRKVVYSVDRRHIVDINIHRNSNGVSIWDN